MAGALVELYIEEDIRELKTKAELPSHLKSSAPKLAKTAIKIYEAGQKELLRGDQEKAYIQYQKYLNICDAVRKSKEYKADKVYYDSLIEKETVLDAMSQADELSASLESRYEEREAERAAAKLRNSASSVTEGAVGDTARSGFSASHPTDYSDEPDDLPNTISSAAESKGDVGEKLEPSITSRELYSMLRSEDHTLLIDVRSEERFNESQIKLESVDLVNIPGDLLTAGILTSKLREKLTARSQSLFDARANYRRIVLLDWSSSFSDLAASSPLQCLKNALYKYDQQTRLASEPQILDRGYADWLKYYPQYSTNALVPSQSSQLSKIKHNLPDLANITYDFLDDEKKTPEVETKSHIPPVNGFLSAGVQPMPAGAASPVTTNQPNMNCVAPPAAAPSLLPQTYRVAPTVNRSNKPHFAVSAAPITPHSAGASGPSSAVQPPQISVSPSPGVGPTGATRPPPVDRTVKPGQRAPPAVPKVNRELKPNLEGREHRLSQLQPNNSNA